MYFSFDPDGDRLTFHKTKKEAREAAEKALEMSREEAGEGWPENVEDICWGEVKGRVVEIDRHPKREDECHSGDETVDYALMKPKSRK